MDLPLRFTVTAAKGEPVRIEGSVEYQGCEEDLCYVPQTTSITFDMGTATKGEGLATEAVPAGEETPSAPGNGEMK